jgi:hypothetical protein
MAIQYKEMSHSPTPGQMLVGNSFDGRYGEEYRKEKEKKNIQLGMPDPIIDNVL